MARLYQQVLHEVRGVIDAPTGNPPDPTACRDRHQLEGRNPPAVRNFPKMDPELRRHGRSGMEFDAARSRKDNGIPGRRRRVGDSEVECDRGGRAEVDRNAGVRSARESQRIRRVRGKIATLK